MSNNIYLNVGITKGDSGIKEGREREREALWTRQNKKERASGVSASGATSSPPVVQGSREG